MIIGIVSGYFNPLHLGHLDYFAGASNNCDKLLVIVNSEHQVRLKGALHFMPATDRAVIVSALGCVDSVIISQSDDKTVSIDLQNIVELFGRKGVSFKFFNSGDRDKDNVPEVEYCKALGIETIFLKQPKVESSSDLKVNLIARYEANKDKLT